MAPSIISDTQELPIAAHVFEGHLYIKDDASNKWLWRLFRFDGTSLTCLSSKKNKLPPHTPLDNPFDINCISSSHDGPDSSLAHSFTSPILATPRHKTDRILTKTSMNSACGSSKNKHSQSISASYYQLPKWTIEMISISSISLLKAKQKKPRPFNFTSSSSSCSFSESKSFVIRTYDGGCYVLKASKQHDLERWIFVLTKMWKFAQTARQIYQKNKRGESIVPQVKHNTTRLAAFDSGSTSNLVSIHNNSNQMTSPIQVTQLPMNASTASHVGQQTHKYCNHDTNLSNEKRLWIEKWVESLAELDSRSSIKSCNDATTAPDSAVPPPQCQRQTSIAQQPTNHDYQPIVTRPPDNGGNSGSEHSQTTLPSTKNEHSKFKARQCPTRYNSDYTSYFQDAKSVFTDETARSAKQKEPATTKQSLKYHNLVRAQQPIVRSHSIGCDVPLPFSAAVLSQSSQSFEHGCSPLDLLEYKYSHDSLLPSPPTTPAFKDDEDVCLADVRKSLQSMELVGETKTEQNLTAKRRSAHLMAKAGGRYRNSWAPSVSHHNNGSTNRNSHLFSTAAFI